MTALHKRRHGIGTRVLKSVAIALGFSVAMAAGGLSALAWTIATADKVSEQHLPAITAIHDAQLAVASAEATGDLASVAASLEGAALAAVTQDAKSRLTDLASTVESISLTDISSELDAIESLEVAAQESTSNSIHVMFTLCLVLVGASVFGALMVGGGSGLRTARTITRDISGVVAMATAMSRGDLTVHASATSNDEVADMTQALNDAMDALREVIATVTATASTLTSAADELDVTTSQMTHAATETAQSCTAVAKSASEVTHHIETVAAGTEQMGASITEISHAATQALGISQVAVAEGDHAASAIGSLEESVQKIDDIVHFITTIAQQTNLLALNATIEAARAGEAGRGFAVVAGEVKNLAQTTAQATDGIASTIVAIQEQTGQALEAVRRIRDVISTVDSHQSAISAAVEQQSATATEMARGIALTAQHSDTITQNMESVAQASDLNAHSVDDSHAAVSDLARLSHQLTDAVARFRA